MGTHMMTAMRVFQGSSTADEQQSQLMHILDEGGRTTRTYR